MTRHWKITAVKDGKHVNLYVTTNERSIAIDLASGAFGSLILATRQSRPCTNLNSEGDHIDLATGVFRHQMPRHGYTQIAFDLVEVPRIPEGLKSFAVGGTKIGGVRLCAATVFEQPGTETPFLGNEAPQHPWRQH